MANHFDPTAKVSALATIEVSSKGTDTRIGANTVVDDFVKIKHVGGAGHIVLGNNVYVNSCSVFYSGNGIRIGNDVLIGPNCSFVPVNHGSRRTDIPMRLQGFEPSQGGIVIEDDVWLGAQVTVMDGAVIKKGCIVSAGSVVMGTLEENGIYAGSPARLMARRG